MKKCSDTVKTDGYRFHEKRRPNIWTDVSVKLIIRRAPEKKTVGIPREGAEEKKKRRKESDRGETELAVRGVDRNIKPLLPTREAVALYNRHVTED